MADNYVANAGSGGNTFASDDVSGTHYPKGKLAFGANDSATDVTTSAGLPVQQQSGATFTVVGGAAHDAPVSGNPVLLAGYGSTAAPTAASAAGDAVYVWVDLSGRVQVGDGGGSITVDGTVTVAHNGLTDLANAGVQTGTLASDPADVLVVGGIGPGTYRALPVDTADSATSGDCLPVGGRASAAAPTDVSADGDSVRAWRLRNGAAATVITCAGALVGGDATNGLDVDVTRVSGTVTVTGTVTANAGSGTLAVSNAGLTDLDAAILANSADLSGGYTGIVALARDESNLATVLTVASNRLQVTGAGGTFPATQSGAWTVGLSAGTATNEVVGDAAHDAAAAGNPLLCGAYASAAAPADVSADGDAVRLWALRSGAQAVQPTYAGVLALAGNGAAGTGVQRVTIANDSTGVLATVGTVTTVSTLTGGGVAHDAADSGNPHKLGAKAESALSGITLVADGDRTDCYAGLDGVLIVRPNCNLEDVVQDRATNTDGASTAFAGGLAAPGANIRLWIKSVTICNSSASFCTVDLRDGSAGSVLWTLPVPATGGVTHVFDPPLKLTANTALAYDASAATTTLTISANGFKSKL